VIKPEVTLCVISHITSSPDVGDTEAGIVKPFSHG